MLPSNLLREALTEASFRYRRIYIKKKSGGIREMIQPSVKLKPILAWIDAVILSQLQISDIATAFCPGSSVIKNATVHRNSPYSIRIDLSDFFHSIKILDLTNAIVNAGSKVPDWLKAPAAQKLISMACFDAKGRLPIGYSTSPKIANIVMFNLDKTLSQLISDTNVFGTAYLTRYADDFVFSTNKKGACREFHSQLETVLKHNISPRLEINSSKTRFMSLKGGSTLVTGLRIKQNREIGIHPNYRDHIRLLLKLYSQKRLTDKETSSLRGHLAFIRHADPALVTKLSFKYYSEISDLKDDPL
jgi:hypothetical protein